MEICHPENPAGTGYPELYEVVEGVAHFLLQKKTLEHIVLVKAAKGDIVLIPLGYGHVTINPSRDEIKCRIIKISSFSIWLM